MAFLCCGNGKSSAASFAARLAQAQGRAPIAIDATPLGDSERSSLLGSDAQPRDSSCCGRFWSSCCLSTCAVSCCLFGVIATFLALGLVLDASIARRALFHTARCFKNSEIDSAFGKVPETLPLKWRGIIWMDHGGTLGGGDEDDSSASLVFSFADATHDPTKRTVKIKTTGKSWSYQNSAEGYSMLWLTKMLGFFYEFEFNSEYSFAQMYPAIQPFQGLLGSWYLPKAVVDHSISVRDRLPENCPPEPGAGTTEVSSYPCFEIVSSAGGKVQPYFNAYEELADSVCKPARGAASLYMASNLVSAGCIDESTSLIGGG